MSLLSGAVTGRSREVKRWIAITYALLIAGGVTMIYPFLVMISGSFKSDVDLRDWDMVPRYFVSDAMLHRKYLESRYEESVTLCNAVTRRQLYAFQQAEPPPAAAEARVDDWRAFLASGRLPASWTLLADASSVNSRMFPKHARGYRAWMARQCGNDIREYHRRYGSLVASWLNVAYPAPVSPCDRAFKTTGSPLEAAVQAYKAGQRPQDLIAVSLDGRYVADFLQLKYGKKIEDCNRAHGTRWGSWEDVTLPERPPAAGRAREDWLEFVRGELNLQFVRVAPAARPAWDAFLAARYGGSLAALRRAHGTGAAFGRVPFPRDPLRVGAPLVDWELFVRDADPKWLRVTGPEFLWRGFLRVRYAGLAALNRAHGAAYASFDAAPIPAREADWREVQERRWALRLEFATRNYRHVIEYLLLHGRGVWNTAVFCVLSILAVLIVNPLAAYAMSRYALPSTYKILLFLMATVAFPPMVTAIPNFLLLKELGLLNTYWALILPGMVNGFSIFLLKGFFDSLPRELYEAAQLDGAGEWTMFWGITMHLSKPILAVITLDAFASAYGAFMFAFIVCQDETMWTLMVWLYQLQQYSHPAVTFAALLVASVPTFLVFIFAQRVILEGLVVPVEK